MNNLQLNTNADQLIPINSESSELRDEDYSSLIKMHQMMTTETVNQDWWYTIRCSCHIWSTDAYPDKDIESAAYYAFEFVMKKRLTLEEKKDVKLKVSVIDLVDHSSSLFTSKVRIQAWVTNPYTFQKIGISLKEAQGNTVWAQGPMMEDGLDTLETVVIDSIQSNITDIGPYTKAHLIVWQLRILVIIIATVGLFTTAVFLIGITLTYCRKHREKQGTLGVFYCMFIDAKTSIESFFHGASNGFQTQPFDKLNSNGFHSTLADDFANDGDEVEESISNPMYANRGNNGSHNELQEGKGRNNSMLEMEDVSLDEYDKDDKLV